MHLGAAELICKHNTEILSPYKDLANMLANVLVAYLHIQRIWSNISIHFELCLESLDECKSSIQSLFLAVLFSTNSLAATCSTMLTSYLLTLSAIWSWAGSIQ